MTVDRGGLEYPITLEDKFSGGLAAFKKQVADARTEMKGLSGDIVAFKKVRDNIGKATTSLAASKAKAAASSKKSTDATDSESAATKKLIRLKKQLADQLDTLQLKSTDPQLRALREEIALEKSRLKAQDQRVQAVNKEIVKQRRLAAVIKQVVAAQDKIAVANNKGVQKAKLQAALAERRAVAERKIAIAKDKTLLRLNGELRAEQAITRFKEQQLKFEKLAAFARQQGLANNAQALQDLGISKSRAKGLGLITAPTKPELSRLQKAQGLFSKLNKSMKATDTTGNRISFTFRRLFGILAAFAIARQAIAGFAALVKEMISFNSQLEQAELGIGALINAVAEVRDSTGNLVDPVRGLVLAQVEARRQINLLRRDALRTVATFEQLRDAFQTALAPGLQAGLNIDEVRGFAVQISQAAAAIGLSQEQLAEEIRSILSGTIRTRTTRIAVALGISNKDIERMKEAGTLSEFLEKRFLAFSIAGEESLKTFNAIFTNLRDGLSLVLGAGGIQFFEALRDLLSDIKGQIIDTDSFGIPRPSPDAIKAVEAIGEGLIFAIEQARSLGEELQFDDIQQVGKAIGQTLKTVAAVIRPVIQGIVDSLGTIAAFLDVASTIFGTIAVSETLEAITQILILSVLINTTWLVVAKTVGIVTTLLGLVNALAKKIQFSFAVTATLLTGIVLLVGGLFLLLSSSTPGDELERQSKAASDMRRVFREMSPILIRNRKTLEEQSELVKKLKNDLVKSVDALRKFNAVRGLSGGAESTASLLIEEDIQLRKDSVVLEKQLSDEIRKREGLNRRRLDVARRVKDLTGFERAALTSINEAQKSTNRLLLEEQRIKTELDLAALEGASDQSEEQIARKDELRRISRQLASEESKRERTIANMNLLLQEDVSLLTSAKDILNTTLGRELAIKEQTQEILNLSEDGLKVNGELLASTQMLKDIKEDLVFLAERENEIFLEKRRLIALQTADELNSSNIIQAIELANRKELADFDADRPVDDAKRSLLIEEQRFDVLKAQAALNERERQANLRVLTTQFAKDFARSGDGSMDRFFSGLIDQIQEIDQELRAIESGTVEATQQRIDSLSNNLNSLTGELTQSITSLNEAFVKGAAGEGPNNSIFDEETNRQYQEQAKKALDFMNQINAVIRDNSLSRGEENQALTETEDRIRSILLILDQPILAGFREGILQLAEELPTEFEQTVELMKDSVRDFSSFTASALTDALSGEDVDIQERFRQLLLGISEQILQVVIQRFIVEQLKAQVTSGALQGASVAANASATALSGAASSFTAAGGVLTTSAGVVTKSAFALGASAKLATVAAGQMAIAAGAMEAAALAMAAASASGGGSFGAASGGHVGALARAKGLAAGGPSLAAIRPAGLHPTDVIPAWLARNEWVIKESSVSRYGSQVMDAINRGLVDPFALKSLVTAQGALRSPVRRHTRGFAAGGQSSTTTVTSPQTDQVARPALAVIVPSNEAMRLLADEGTPALLDWMADNGFERGGG